MAEFKEMPKNSNPTNHLHVLNLFIASIAGLISIVGGVYSIKSNFFVAKTGALEGIVRDESIAKPLYLARVEISETDGSVIATINTNSEGHYKSETLKEGNYTVKASALLHETQSKEIKVYSGAEAEVNFDLAPKKEKSIISEKTTPISQIPRQQMTPSTSYAAPPISPSSLPSGYVPPAANLPATENYSSVQPTRAFHRRFPRTDTMPSSYNQGGTASGSSNTLASAVSQVAGEFLQSWAEKKSQGNTSG